MINERTIPCRILILWIVLASCILLLCSCSDNQSASDSVDQNASDRTGALALKLVYHGADDDFQTQDVGFNCQDIGVETIEALVFDEKNKQIAQAGPWKCVDRKGTIDSITPGVNRTVVLFGRDIDEHVVFRGEQSGMQVNAGHDDTPRLIDCYDFVPKLQIPPDSDAVMDGSMPLEWTVVTGADQYRVQVSENRDMSDPFVDEIKTGADYSFSEALSSTKTYYWRVFAVDAFGNEGVGSPIRLVGANFMFTVATGSGHTLAVKPDGTLWSWGNNVYGQLGVGDHGVNTERSRPTQVGVDKDWYQVSAGSDHTVAIKTDGTLWTWGNNESYQLGNSQDNNPINQPIQIGSDRDWNQVAAGDQYTLALKTNGEIWGWGNNNNGQLGLGHTATSQSEPELVIGTDWAYVAAGTSHALAIKTTGEMWGWGDNQLGQLGISDFRDHVEPVEIDTAIDWAIVSAGMDHSVAVKTSGTIWTWGNSTSGQLGHDDLAGRRTPSQMGTENDWSYAVASKNHTFAIKNSGELWAWGDNYYSQLGFGYTSRRAAPEKVGDARWLFVTSNEIHAAAVSPDGEIWSWGSNFYGQIGNGRSGIKREPALLNTETDWEVIAIGSSNRHTLAKKTNGELWAWGKNSLGRLGIGDLGNQGIPIQVGTDADWKMMSTGNRFSAAIKETNNGNDHTLWTWGENSYGQLGLGNQGDGTERSVPNQVGTDTHWSDVSAGGKFAVAIKTDGTLWSWGNNVEGQLGLGDKGTGRERTTPSRVGTDNDYAAVSAGMKHTVAIKTNNTLWSWGDNAEGRLGLGDGGEGTERTSPAQVGTDQDWETVSTGYNHTLAIKTDGTLWSWGDNSRGQLGVGDTNNRNRPTRVGNDTENNWASVTAADWYTIAMKTDGTLWAWGSNYLGKLGDKTISDYAPNPSQIGTDSDWASVQTGAGHTIVIKTDGTLWGWGWNLDGQLGDGTGWELVPIHIPIDTLIN